MLAISVTTAVSANTSENELSTCPYCGKAPAGAIEIDVAMWAVVCDSCRAIGPIAHGESGAVATWNQRKLE